jgi:hypothetical protein
MTELMQRILQAKRTRRKELAALPVGEKLRMLEEMIEATRSIAASRPRKPAKPGANKGG